jgi:hypothetical protein
VSALLKLPFDPGDDDAADEREFEALTEALNEVTAKCAAGAVEQDRANARRAELMSAVGNHRRRRARTLLDRFLPPITFYQIEFADPTPEEIVAFADESVEVDAEIRRHQKLLGLTDALVNQFVRQTWKISARWPDLNFRYRRLLLGALREKAKPLTSLKGAL